MVKNYNKKVYIFSKYLNNKYKYIPFNVRETYIGNNKYFPPTSKEWKNSIYSFNNNNIKNIPAYDININELIKNYFNSYFNHKFIFNKEKLSKNKYSSLNNIYVSKAEIKHTNNKAIITIYVYNREKISLIKKIKSLKKVLSFIWILIYKSLLIMNPLSSMRTENYLDLKDSQKKEYLEYLKKLTVDIQNFFDNKDFYSGINRIGLKKLLYKELILLRKYKLRLNLNKYKFEEKLLFKLNNLIMKIYNKKVEFNIVNMKSIVLNSEFITKILTLKVKDKKSDIINILGMLFKKVILPITNTLIERSVSTKGADLNLISNKYLNNHLLSILGDSNNNLSELLNKLYYNVIPNNNLSNSKNYAKIYEIIFNSIKYKNIGGVRFEIKGRLSKRNKADKSISYIESKGGLKNIDPSYKRISSVNIRGYAKPNVDYSIFTSKRPVGAFAVKGWVSGK